MLMRTKHGPIVLATRDPAIAQQVAAALSAMGPQAPRLSSVSSMPECVHAVRLLRPAVVLLDDDVTDRPGPQLLEELTAAQPGVLVVYIAAHHSLDLEREIRKGGVLFYVARPVEMETLESTLVGILQGLLRGSN
jgi:DNA-binding NtrC family response regulator